MHKAYSQSYFHSDGEDREAHEHSSIFNVPSTWQRKEHISGNYTRVYIDIPLARIKSTASLPLLGFPIDPDF